MLTGDLLKKMLNMHTMEYYCLLKVISHATTWINLEDIMLNEISQSLKDRYCTISLISSKVVKIIQNVER